MELKKKLEANEFGKFAEEIVAQEYQKRGFTILEKRFKSGKSEIDLIAQKDDNIIFIEVKARSGKDENPLATVTLDKRRRMVKVADSFLQRLQGEYFYRFDIGTVVGNTKEYSIEIYEDAFVAADLF